MEQQLNCLQALRQALMQEMRRDPNVIFLGEDVRHSLRGISKGCLEEFGEDRVWDTPISEQGFVGMATGAAISGLRPVVEFQIGTLLYVCFDQIVDQAQKLRYMMGGQGRIPVTYLVPGSGARAGLAGQHSDHLYPMLVQAGLKVVIPSCPLDAKGLFTAAIREDDPVVIFAPAASMNVRGPVPEEEVYIPLGKADVKHAGSDVTVVAIGPLVPDALKLAKRLQGEGISVEVFDPRSLLPFDHASLAASVIRTGRLVVFDDSNRSCGMAAEIAAFAAESLFAHLRAPILRITRADVPVPFSIAIDKYVLPKVEQLEAAIRSIVCQRELAVSEKF
ncbi:alpha-ketoacid dehydrogenase subunit beta [Bryobacter aggregatus]|uniref:alpha-ketoacid dehydrogenase subunit beta n=1 Tax=Bryobacter aggregatus TaxID=360054 RepID=UPI0004E1E335|nr:transketolase C-terminal domain-containing protein [Bryobacter aggregatus]